MRAFEKIAELHWGKKIRLFPNKGAGRLTPDAPSSPSSAFLLVILFNDENKTDGQTDNPLVSPYALPRVMAYICWTQGKERERENCYSRAHVRNKVLVGQWRHEKTLCAVWPQRDSPFSLLLLWPFVATFNRRGGIGEIVGHRALLSTKMERPPAKGEKFTQSQRARKKENAILGWTCA